MTEDLKSLMWSVRASPALKARVDEAAAREGISASAYMMRAAESYLELGENAAERVAAVLAARAALRRALRAVDDLFEVTKRKR